MNTQHENESLERSTLAAVSRRLMPSLFALYIIAYLDRVNVGFAALRMNADLGFDPAVFGFGAGIFFIGYALFEVPSNLALARFGARVWIARIMITWGALSAGMMFTESVASFYILRFLLGVAEAGFFPGIIYYLGQWFPAEARSRAIAKFAIAIPISGIIGGPLSGALLNMDGIAGLRGWQWMFLLEGLPAVVCGFLVYRYLPEGPANVRWLNDRQRQWLTNRLDAERAANVTAQGHAVGKALLNPRVWQIGLLIFLCVSIGQYSLGFWLPQILATYTLTPLVIGWLSAVPGVTATAAMLAVARIADRTGKRCLIISSCALVAALGFVICSQVSSLPMMMLGLCIAQAGFLSAISPCLSLPSRFLTGAAAAGGIALANSIANVSGFIGPYAMGVISQASGGFNVALVWLSALPIGGMLLALRLRRELDTPR